MRPRARTVGTVALAVALVIAQPASAGSGRDPNDVPGDRYDIAWVSVRATREPNGVAIFRIALRTYRGFRLRDCDCVFAWILDGRGDGRGDLVIVTRGRSDGPRIVGIARRPGDGFAHEVVVHKDGWRRIRVVIPRDWLEPTGAVRFRATSRADGTTDRAPNAGRYVA